MFSVLLFLFLILIFLICWSCKLELGLYFLLRASARARTVLGLCSLSLLSLCFEMCMFMFSMQVGAAETEG